MKPADDIDHGLLLCFGALVLALSFGMGCRRGMPEDLMVVTQTPLALPDDFTPADFLDERYPPGSRVVIVRPGSKRSKTQVLSSRLHAAGSPVLGPDGDRVLFVGKATADAAWQIYESPITRGTPVARTSMPQGAMGPVYLPDGRFAFSAPVPKLRRDLAGPGLPELYAQRVGDPQPTRLTFGLAGALDATVLGDGRILFVSGGSAHVPITNQALFTINTDGTEISAFAGQHDGRARIRRPRETPDGRVWFLSSELDSSGWDSQLENVLAARPFSSRARFGGTAGTHLRSAEPANDGRLLVTTTGGNAEASFGVYALRPNAANPPSMEPVFDDPRWHEVEVAVRRPGPGPMGRLSTVDESGSTGLLLCLDANNIGESTGREGADAKSVRLLRPTSEGTLEWLGEIPLQADGSFLVEVPANTLLGLETLDETGRVVNRLPPAFWVRPGENRSCVGCHEPHNTCPENRRPLAVKQAPSKLDPPGRGLAQSPPKAE